MPGPSTSPTRRSELERKAARASYSNLYAFTRNFWHVLNSDPFTDNWHIHYVCKVLEQYVQAIVSRRKIDDLIINIPPGASKSTMVSQMFPAFLWLHAPWAVVISSGYSDGLSVEHAMKSKAVILSEQYKRWFGPLFEPIHGKPMILVKNTEKWYTNNFGGQRFATATGGTVTGKHAHVIIRDDPADPFKAESSAYRKQEKRFNDTTLSSRKKNKLITPTITVMQRLHVEDTTGRDLSKGIPLRHICLPATIGNNVSPPELSAFYVDGLLDPNRMPKSVLDDERKRLGSYGYSGQYDQRPSPEGGGIIKAKWFPTYDPLEIPWESAIMHYYVDTAYTKDQENDPSVIMAFARIGYRLLIVDVGRVWMELPELLKYIPRFMEQTGATATSSLIIEKKASGPSIAQMLRISGFNLVEDDPGTLDKVARANAVTPVLEARRVEIPKGAAWVDEFMNEITSFPNGRYKDQVDTLTGGIRKLLINRPKRTGIRGATA